MAKTDRAVLEESIDARLSACQFAVEYLIDGHRRFGASLDHEHPDNEQWVAIWDMGGRCLSLSNAYLDLLRRGFAVESLVTARAIREATRELSVLMTADDHVLEAMESAFSECVSSGNPRVFFYGPHPDWAVRARHVDHCVLLTEVVLTQVGSALRRAEVTGFDSRELELMADALRDPAAGAPYGPAA
jgi:hypothetical protein